MNGKPKKLKDVNNQEILPVTHADLVYVEANKNLTQKLSEIGAGGNGASIDDTSTTATDKTWSASQIYTVTEGKADKTHGHDLQEITDVDVTNKTNGYALQYDSTSGKFVSKPLPSGAGSGATNLDGLSDVDTTTSAPLEDDVLSFKSGVWKPSKVTASSAEFQTNAETPLNIPSYYEGKGQGCHPSVLYFSSKYKGYHYWMAFTPYPNSDSYHENPVIVASNNGVDWEVPNGLINPIDSIDPAVKGNEYFSDTALVYRNDTGVLECWYRKAILAPVKGETIYRKTTTTGTTWSAAEELYHIDYAVSDRVLSPAVVWDNTNKKYLIWAVENYKVIYYESPDGKAWTRIRDTGLTCWHIDVIKTDVGYEYLLQKTNSADATLNHVVSSDNIAFGTEKVLLKGKPNGFWDMQLYRSALVKIGTQYRVYYSAMSSEKVWGIGLSIATKANDITSLKGYDGKSNPLTNTNIAYVADNKLWEVLPRMVGTSEQRRALYLGTDNAKHVGLYWFDTTLGKPLWLKKVFGGNVWVDATGTTVS